MLDRVALGNRRDVAATALSHGDQRKLEVALMIALEPKIFMFDEPTAGMSVDEVPVVLDLIAQLKQDTEQDHPAGRAQDGRGALARRPHHRAAQRQAGRRRQAGRGDRLADRAGGLSRHRFGERAPHERSAHALRRRTPISGAITSCTASISACRRARPRCCSAATAPARPRRCAPSWACGAPPPARSARRRAHRGARDARHRARRHRLCAGDHGGVLRPHGEGKPGARGARRARWTTRGSTGFSASSRR